MFRKETRSFDLWDDWKSFVPRGSQNWSRMIDPWNGQFIESLSLMHYLLTTKDKGIEWVLGGQDVSMNWSTYSIGTMSMSGTYYYCINKCITIFICPLLCVQLTEKRKSSGGIYRGRCANKSQYNRMNWIIVTYEIDNNIILINKRANLCTPPNRFWIQIITNDIDQWYTLPMRIINNNYPGWTRTRGGRGYSDKTWHHPPIRWTILLPNEFKSSRWIDYNDDTNHSNPFY